MTLWLCEEYYYAIAMNIICPDMIKVHKYKWEAKRHMRHFLNKKVNTQDIYLNVSL